MANKTQIFNIMNHLNTIYTMDWSEIGWSAFGVLMLVLLIWGLIKHYESKDEFEANQNLFLPREKQPEADQIRYNKILDSIENFNETQTISLEEYRRAKETVWKFERQTS